MSEPPILEAAWKEIEGNRYHIIRQYLQLLRRHSVSKERENARTCAEFIKSQMSALGIPGAQLLESAGNPVVFASVPGATGAPTVILYAHYDTKPAEGQTGWGNYPPFEPTITVGLPTDDARQVRPEALEQEDIRQLRVVCRGATDDKLGVGELIHAVAACIRTGKELPVNVKFLLEGDEEVGSPAMKKFLEKNRKLLESDAFIVADGSKAPEGPRVVLGARGIIDFQVRITGARLDTHSGAFGDVIANPAEKLARLLSSCRDAQGKVLIEGFYDNIAPPGDAERKLVEKLPFDKEKTMQEIGIGQQDWQLPVERSYHEATMFWPTFNVEGFAAGTNSTIVPSEATAWVDIRLVPSMDFDRIREKVLKHVAEQGFPHSIISHFSGYNPYRCAADDPFARVVLKGMKRAFNREVLVYPSMGGSVPVSVFNQVLGAPCICVPLGNHDAHAHGPRENLPLQDLIDGTKAIVSILSSLGEVTC